MVVFLFLLELVKEQGEGNDLYNEMIESGVIKLDSPDSKAALVYGQMNEPPGARARVALTGLTMAEYFRDQEGQDVLLLSITYLDLLKLARKFLLFLEEFRLQWVINLLYLQIWEACRNESLQLIKVLSPLFRQSMCQLMI